MPGPAKQKEIIETLRLQVDTIQIQFTDLSSGLETDLKNLLDTKQKQFLKRLAFTYCRFDKISSATIAEIANLLATSNAEVVGLNSNNLGDLSKENIQLILNALTNPNIKGIELKNNDLNKIIAQYPELFGKFLESVSAVCLNLTDNNISDQSAIIIGKHTKTLKIELSKNAISDAGCKTFLTNPYLTSLNLNFTNVQLKVMNRLYKKMLHNQNRPAEDKFISQVIELSKGLTNPTHNLSRLPREIWMTIFHFLGNGLRSKEAITNVCTLILYNVTSSKPGKLFWAQILMIGSTPKRIFKNRHQFFANNPKVDAEKVIRKSHNTMSFI